MYYKVMKETLIFVKSIFSKNDMNCFTKDSLCIYAGCTLLKSVVCIPSNVLNISEQCFNLINMVLCMNCVH